MVSIRETLENKIQEVRATVCHLIILQNPAPPPFQPRLTFGIYGVNSPWHACWKHKLQAFGAAIFVEHIRPCKK